MKKNIKLIICMIVWILTLIGCGGESNTTKDETNYEQNTTAEIRTTINNEIDTDEKNNENDKSLEALEYEKYNNDINKLKRIDKAINKLLQDVSRGEGTGEIIFTLEESYGKEKEIVLLEMGEFFYDKEGILTFKSESKAFENVNEKCIYVHMNKDTISVLVPVNENAGKEYVAYCSGTYDWPEEIRTLNKGEIEAGYQDVSKYIEDEKILYGKQRSYSDDIRTLDSICTALRMYIANTGYTDTNGENSLKKMIEKDVDGIILSVIGEVFSYNEEGVLTFTSSSSVFENVTVEHIFVFIENGVVSVLVPVNERYDGKYDEYINGPYEWSDEMKVF